MTCKELANKLLDLPTEKQDLPIFIRTYGDIQPSYDEVERVESMMLYEGDIQAQSMILRAEGQ